MTETKPMPTPNYPDELSQIGEALHQKRIEKGLSLRQVNGATLISERHLKAIEEGDWSSLPEPVYVQGFVRKYAQYLGLTELCQKLTVDNQLPSPTWSGNSAVRLGALHLYAIYVLFVVVAVNILASHLANDPTRLEAIVEITPTIVPPPAPAPTAPQNLSLIMLGESWVRISTDGNVTYEGIMAEGRTMTVSARQQIILRVGNGAAVAVRYNNGIQTTLGTAGEVVEKSYGQSPPKTGIPFRTGLW